MEGRDGEIKTSLIPYAKISSKTLRKEKREKRKLRMIVIKENVNDITDTWIANGAKKYGVYEGRYNTLFRD